MEIELIDDILESLLFVSGDGLKISDICELLELQTSEVKASVKRLSKKFGGKSGIHLISYAGKIQFMSNPEYSDVIACVLNPIKEKALSGPAMETLSIIAYRQPVTRLDIEHIRGANCDYTLQALLKNNLIEIVGRKEALGRPLLFGTTETFLKRFRIENLSELPDREVILAKIKEIEEKTPEMTEEELYNFAKREENPAFLQGEDVEVIEADVMDEAAATDVAQESGAGDGADTPSES